MMFVEVIWIVDSFAFHQMKFAIISTLIVKVIPALAARKVEPLFKAKEIKT